MEIKDKIIEEIFALSKKENCKIIYPDDVVVSKDLNGPVSYTHLTLPTILLV